MLIQVHQKMEYTVETFVLSVQRARIINQELFRLNHIENLIEKLFFYLK